MEKRVMLSLLVDFYGSLLTDHQRRAARMYGDEDLSFQEIADQLGITRQGAHDAIKVAARKLSQYEESLGLARRYGEIRREVERCRARLNAVDATDETRAALHAAMKALDAIEWIEG